MRNSIFLFFFLCFNLFGKAQDIPRKLSEAMKNLQQDPQLAHAIIAMSVMENASGKFIFEQNGETGLAPASCQKIVTSVSAFALLGKQFTYQTKIGIGGPMQGSTLTGDIIVSGAGDPSFASWRWPGTKKEMVMRKINDIIKRQNIKNVQGRVFIDDLIFGLQPLPDGWIWQDIGNYYGAGAWGFNWNENQYDLKLRTGKRTGDQTEVIETTPVKLVELITNNISTGAPGSGDNGYVYAPPFATRIFTSGTIPPAADKGVGESFTISGSMPNPPLYFAEVLQQYLAKENISFSGKPGAASTALLEKSTAPLPMRWLDSMASPSLDSMNYWFLRKSINLYGEAFLKTIAKKITGEGTTDKGVEALRNFWAQNGIEKAALRIFDGSGLSPANRVTTKSLVTILSYAARQPWYESFFEDLPVMNGIHMKDGYINGVRSYSGYIANRQGKTYTFSFIVNNFDGSPGSVREKMWKVLDLLK